MLSFNGTFSEFLLFIEASLKKFKRLEPIVLADILARLDNTPLGVSKALNYIAQTHPEYREFIAQVAACLPQAWHNHYTKLGLNSLFFWNPQLEGVTKKPVISLSYDGTPESFTQLLTRLERIHRLITIQPKISDQIGENYTGYAGLDEEISDIINFAHNEKQRSECIIQTFDNWILQDSEASLFREQLYWWWAYSEDTVHTEEEARQKFNYIEQKQRINCPQPNTAILQLLQDTPEQKKIKLEKLRGQKIATINNAIVKIIRSTTIRKINAYFWEIFFTIKSCPDFNEQSLILRSIDFNHLVTDLPDNLSLHPLLSYLIIMDCLKPSGYVDLHAIDRLTSAHYASIRTPLQTMMLLELYPGNQLRINKLIASKSLQTAVSSGDTTSLKICLQYYIHLEALEANDHDALRHAVKSRKLEFIMMILNAYPTKEARIRGFIAANALEFLYDNLNLLLQFEVLEIDNHAALRYAVASGRLKIAMMILKAYPSDEARIRGLIASDSLHKAFNSGHIESFKIYLEYYLQSPALEANNHAPLRYAVASGKYELVRMVFEAYSTNETRLRGLLATKPRDKEVREYIYDNLKILIENNSEPLLTEDYAVLRYVTKSGVPELLTMTLDRYPTDKLRLRGLIKAKILNLAIRNGDHKNFEILIQYLVDLKAIDADNHAALRHAVSSGDYELVKKVLNAYRTNKQRRKGLQAHNHDVLQRAIQYGYNDIFKMLLNHYMRTRAFTTDHHAALRIALESGNPKLIETVLESYPTRESQLEGLRTYNHFVLRKSFQFWWSRATQQFLLKYYAKLGALDVDNHAALRFTVESSMSYDSLDIVLKAYPTNEAAVQGLRSANHGAMRTAILYGYHHSVEILLNAYIKLQALEADNHAVLRYAVIAAIPKLVIKILEAYHTDEARRSAFNAMALVAINTDNHFLLRTTVESGSPTLVKMMLDAYSTKDSRLAALEEFASKGTVNFDNNYIYQNIELLLQYYTQLEPIDGYNHALLREAGKLGEVKLLHTVLQFYKPDKLRKIYPVLRTSPRLTGMFNQLVAAHQLVLSRSDFEFLVNRGIINCFRLYEEYLLAALKQPSCPDKFVSLSLEHYTQQKLCAMLLATANALRQTGNIEESKSLLDEAISVDPTTLEPNTPLSRVMHVKTGSQITTGLRLLLGYQNTEQPPMVRKIKKVLTQQYLTLSPTAENSASESRALIRS